METQADILRLEGIFSKGYGIVPKFVMHDRDLTLEAKAIYAYLCALAGSGDQTFPYRDTILRDLGLSKNTYYRHYNLLLQEGYLTVQRPPDKTAANIYTLVSNPKKLTDTRPAPDKNKAWLRYRGLKSRGYGTIPRLVMTDRALTAKAKGLYAYLCSYCGAGDCAFPRREDMLHHLGVSEPTYYKALNQLKDRGYLAVNQRLESGRFAVNDYYLCETPDPWHAKPPEGDKPAPLPEKGDLQDVVAYIQQSLEREEDPETQFPALSAPCPKNWDTKTGASPCPNFRDTKKPYPNIRDIKNRDTLSKNSSSNNSLSSNSPSSGPTDREAKGDLLAELRRRATRQPLSQRGLLYQVLNQLSLLSEGEGEGRLPAIDPLWDSLLAFCRHYRSGTAGKPVRNKTAYLRASLQNWLTEAPAAARAGETAPSYDLTEMERLLERGIL